MRKPEVERENRTECANVSLAGKMGQNSTYDYDVFNCASLDKIGRLGIVGQKRGGVFSYYCC